ncbi:hypothetical protein [Streptomyces daliensis]
MGRGTGPARGPAAGAARGGARGGSTGRAGTGRGEGFQGDQGFQWGTALLLYLAMMVLWAALLVLVLWAGWKSTEMRAALVPAGAALIAVFVSLVGAGRTSSSLTEFVVAGAAATLTLFLLLRVITAQDAGRPDDVTARTKISGGASMTEGSTAEVAVDARDAHGTLELTLAVGDVEEASGSPCVPLSSLHFSGPDLDGSRTVTAREETSVTLPLKSAEARVRLDVTLTTEEGCALSLTKKKTVLRD